MMTIVDIILINFNVGGETYKSKKEKDALRARLGGGVTARMLILFSLGDMPVM